MSVKKGLLKWLGGFVAFDILVLGALIGPQLATEPASVRITGALTTFLAPPAILLLTTIIPHAAKHALIFWRFKNVLPSHRAFSSYAPKDARINLQRLHDRVGELPVHPIEQQNLWFGIYQQHKTDAAVVAAHRLFLIFRDLAALSLSLAVAVPLLLWIYGFSFAVWAVLTAFLAQYLLAVLASRQAGTRFVCTVLSLESHSMEHR